MPMYRTNASIFTYTHGMCFITNLMDYTVRDILRMFEYIALKNRTLSLSLYFSHQVKTERTNVFVNVPQAHTILYIYHAYNLNTSLTHTNNSQLQCIVLNLTKRRNFSLIVSYTPLSSLSLSFSHIDNTPNKRFV